MLVCKAESSPERHYWLFGKELQLPSNIIQLVACICGDSTSLRWHATCTTFFRVRLPLRGVFIGLEFLVSEHIAIFETVLPDLCIQVCPRKGYKSHLILDSISSQHAKEITHLAISCWHDGVELPVTRLNQHGIHLSALRALVVHHERKGRTNSPLELMETCLQQLLANLASKLRTLYLWVPYAFNIDSVISNTSLREGLHYLAIDCKPEFCGISTPEYTAEKADEVRQHFPQLKEPAKILCHTVMGLMPSLQHGPRLHEYKRMLESLNDKAWLMRAMSAAKRAASDV